MSIFNRHHVKLFWRGPLVAFSAGEFAQGQDLDGDGTIGGFALFVHDVSTQTTTNLGGLESMVFRDLGEFVGPFQIVEGGRVLFRRDPYGPVQIFDSITGVVTDTGVGSEGYLVDPLLLVDGTILPIRHLESLVDLNGDGDTNDAILHLHDRSTTLTTPMNLAVDLFTVASASLVVVRVPESQQGMDLNGDGDVGSERVAHVIRPSGVGNVNSGAGAVAEVLRVNNGTGVVRATVGEEIEVCLDSAPLGPASGRYVMWAWTGGPENPVTLARGMNPIGTLVNPTPAQPLEMPQPSFCVVGDRIPAGAACGETPVRPGPAFTPWCLRKGSGLPVPLSLTLQAVLQDSGAGNATAFSTTNAVKLIVE